MRKFTKEEMELKLYKCYGDLVTIDIKSYQTSMKKALFFDKDFGEFYALPHNVFRGHGHSKRRAINQRKTFLKKYGVINISCLDSIKEKKKTTTFNNYGVDNPAKSENIKTKQKQTMLDRYGMANASQIPEFALKQAKSVNNTVIKLHWKTNEELICQGSYETKVIDYLNNNQLDFLWQPQTFVMPSGKTYRPDLFLVNENKWIEIKGYMRKDAQEKWDWFKSQFPCAELWNKEKLKQLEIL